MKYGVLMNVYCEAEWLSCAIDSVLSWCDEMVIIEGAYEIAIKAGANPRSNDGTLEILDRYRSNPKVTILHKNERDEAPQLQHGLEVLKQKNVHYYLLVDGDEVWQLRDLELLKRAAEANEIKGFGYYQWNVHFTNFINSFDQCYPSVMKRFFKLTPCAKAVGQNGIIWEDERLGTSGRHITTFYDFVKCFHYTEVKPSERWLLKKRYLKVRDGNPRFDSWYADKNGLHNDEKQIYKFTGKHPEIVKNTDLYKLWKKDPELLRQKLFGDAE